MLIALQGYTTKSVEYHINHHNINKALNSSSNLTLTSNTSSNLMLTTQDVHSNFAVSCNALIFVKLF